MNMNLLSSDKLILVIVIIALGVAALAVLLVQRQRTVRLRRRFGAEYDRALARCGSRAKAEAELLRREQRVARLKIVDLTASDARQYSLRWEALQTRFVDNPKGAVMDADQLVQEVMQRRGYPMEEFENLADDLSTRFPNIVSNYLAARSIAARTGKQQTATEDLRQALVHYRSLFDELVGVARTPTSHSAVGHIPVHS